jgi:hypothetical protein
MAGLSAVSLFGADEAAAKKKRRKRKKKRCKKLRDACTPGGKKKCCDKLPCDEVLGHSGFFCCKEPQAPCEGDQDCCGNHVCGEVDGGEPVCCVDEGFSCENEADCCGGLDCDTIKGMLGDHCCRGEDSPCADDGDCCGDQTFCDDGNCAPCPFPCAAGERCVQGTCTCNPFDNTCPDEVDGQCTCGAIVRLDPDEFVAACVDRNSACDLDAPCETNEECGPGRVCLLGCADDPPRNRCSNPCVPV